MRRAKFLRKLELVVAQIASDDRAGPGEACALDDVEPDATTSNDQHAGAGPGRGRDGLPRRYRCDVAADYRGMGERHVVADFDDLLGGQTTSSENVPMRVI